MKSRKAMSEIGIIYLNNQNTKGIMQRVEKLGLEVVELIPFQTHIYLREDHPLTQKEELVMEDLAAFADCSFTQEKDEYLYYSENFVDTSASSQMFNVTDRATLNGILERTMLMRLVLAFGQQQCGMVLLSSSSGTTWTTTWSMSSVKMWS